ncbi:MAG TPA: bifunctional diguanylate cyclase/phosphodiesterase [Nocardioidaceae bacterium]|nr:bifunctional diguanylate cyclase/phosphodiesterase [Nocardioidaceae bacterium]
MRKIDSSGNRAVLGLAADSGSGGSEPSVPGASGGAKVCDQAILVERCAAAIGEAAKGKTPALLVVALGGVQVARDTGGHTAVDELLGVITSRLAGEVHGLSCLARLGDDEFGVLFDHLPTTIVAMDVARRMMSAATAPVTLSSQRRVELSASCGLATWRVVGPNADPAAMLRAADLAAREARRTGRNRVEVCTREMIGRADEKAEIGRDLRRALSDQGLGVCYQPLVDIRDGSVLGFEALVRWSHPVHGQVPPSRFVPLAEEFGLISELGRVVLSTSTAQVQEWSAALGVPLTVHVNVSGLDLAADGFVDMVAGCLEASGLSPFQLVLEVTESAVIPDLDAAKEKFARLRNLGVRIAMDDFGTGRSSVAHVQALSVDILKVDRSYLEDGDADHNEDLLQGVIAVGKALGMQVYGEGIEDETQRSLLAKHGCTVGQGYLFSQPLTAQAASTYLRSNLTAVAG